MSARKARTHARQRARFPLWVKLGLLFGSLMAVFVSAQGWWDFQSDLQREMEIREQRLLGLAESMAMAIDGDLHASFRSSRDMKRPKYQHLARWLVASTKANQVRWAGTLTMDDEGHLSYVIDGSSTAQLPVGYPIFDVYDVHHQAYEGRTVYQAGIEDEQGRWDSAFSPIRNRAGQVVGLLELDQGANARELLLAMRTRRLLIRIAIGVLLAIVTAVVFAHYLSRPLGLLTRTALEVADGNLDQRVEVPTRDEIGLLGGAFNEMVKGLKERELIRDTFGRYVTEEVVSRVLSDPESLALGGEIRRVTILISDLRGFTSMSEHLGAQQMVALLNRYFSSMADQIMAFAGTLSEFTGDGIVAFFGAPESHSDDPVRAVACAVAMQQELQRFNASEGRELEMGIGIDTGDVIAGNIGSEKRMKYGVVGAAINLAARLESFTVGSQVLISSSTCEEIGAERLEISEPARFRAKGMEEPVVGYYVRAVGEPHDLRMPCAADEGPLVPLDLEASCFRLEGKQVEATCLPGRVTSLSRSRLRMKTSWKPEILSNLKLRLWIGPDHAAEQIYGKVTSVAERGDGQGGEQGYQVEVRLTSVPEEAHELLARLLEGGGHGRT